MIENNILRILVRLGFVFLGAILLGFVLFFVSGTDFRLKRMYWMLIVVCFIALFVILALGLFVQWQMDLKKKNPRNDSLLDDD